MEAKKVSDSKTVQHRIVMPPDINGFGRLFGGQLANVKHFFTLWGKMFFTSYGKEFFTYPGKQIFTLSGKHFFTWHGKQILLSIA